MFAPIWITFQKKIEARPWLPQLALLLLVLIKQTNYKTTFSTLLLLWLVKVLTLIADEEPPIVMSQSDFTIWLFGFGSFTTLRRYERS